MNKKFLRYQPQSQWNESSNWNYILNRNDWVDQYNDNQNTALDSADVNYLYIVSLMCYV